MLHSARKARPVYCKWLSNHFPVKWHSQSKQGCQNSKQSRLLYAQSRFFSHSSTYLQQQKYRTETFSFKLKKALRNTKVQWRPIPVGLGIGFLGAFQLYRTKKKHDREKEEDEDSRRVGDSVQTRETPISSKAGPW